MDGKREKKGKNATKETNTKTTTKDVPKARTKGKEVGKHFRSNFFPLSLFTCSVCTSVGRFRVRIRHLNIFCLFLFVVFRFK